MLGVGFGQRREYLSGEARKLPTFNLITPLTSRALLSWGAIFKITKWGVYVARQKTLLFGALHSGPPSFMNTRYNFRSPTRIPRTYTIHVRVIGSW